jgi:hypothetical protein
MVPDVHLAAFFEQNRVEVSVDYDKPARERMGENEGRVSRRRIFF